MDETVYQCPECNFNADNLTELDGHIIEHHSNEMRHNDKQMDTDIADEGDGGGGEGGGDDETLHQEDEFDDILIENEIPIESTHINNYTNNDEENEIFNDDYYYENDNYPTTTTDTNRLPINKPHNLRAKQPIDYNDLNGTSSADTNKNQQFQQPQIPTPQKRTQQVTTPSVTNPAVPVINSDNHYERQYTCKRCGFFTNNPRAVLYHRKEFHFEKINVHECSYCQYASQYSGKVERHTLLRHKIDINNSPTKKLMNSKLKSDFATNSTNQNSSALDITLNMSTIGDESKQDLNVAKFQCNKCPCKYKRSNDLYKHLKLKHGILAQRLSDYLTQENSEDLKNQQEDDQDLNEDIFNETNNYTDENKQINENKINSYECPYCTYYSNGNDAEYLLHVKDHLCGKSFRCVLCNSVYKYRGDCVVHLKRKHQKSDLYAQNYVERFNLDAIDISQVCVLLKPKQQEETENEEKLFSCSYCDYKANYKGDVFKHQTRRHPGSPKNVTALNPSVSTNDLNQSYLDINRKQRVKSNLAQETYDDNQTEDNEIIELDSNYQETDYYYNNNQINDSKYSESVNEYNEDENLFQEDYNNTTNYDDQTDLEVINDETDYYKDDSEQTKTDDHQFQCKFCSFVAKNHAKLQLHLATHYNLKPFMCPICNRRANFKWDIQKHLRKIHNDYVSEVICLSETEARQSISSYIEGKQPIVFDNNVVKRPASSLSSLSSNNSNKLDEESNLIKLEDSSESNNLRMIARQRTQNALRERKFKCSLCDRDSKWQWDIRKHLRTVHRGQTGGDVIVLRENDIIKKQDITSPTKITPTFCQIRPKPMNGNLSLNTVYSTQTNGNSPMSYLNKTLPTAPTASCSDPTGNKKFKCTVCPYRSNWKADLFRHLKKRHFVQTPQLENVIILDSEYAASSLEEYEQVHGIHVRKRSRTDLDITMNSSNTNDGMSTSDNKKLKYNPDLDSDMDPTNQLQQQENNIEFLNRTNRLPVSIAELNIKPYKCLKCGFRSDRKSDTLRHIRVKHSQTVNAVKFLRIMSIKEASDTIESYENMRLYKKIKNFNSDAQTNIYEEANIYGMNDEAPMSNQQETFEPVETELNQVQNETKTCSNPCCDLYRCPFCSFKNISKLIMRRHLGIHFSDQKVKIHPMFRCSICTFKSKWKFNVKKHILINHLSIQNAYVLKVVNKKQTNNNVPSLNVKNLPQEYETEQLEEEEQQENEHEDPDQEEYENEEEFNNENETAVNGTHNYGNETTMDDEEDEEEDEEEEEDFYHSNDTNSKEESDSYLIDDKTDESQRQTETIVLTGYDGAQFQATFQVSNPIHHSIGSQNGFKKKVYYCQTCPYKTSNYSNLRQHLLQHRYQEGYFQCRYCVYYVSKVRLLKQHEILHPEFELRLTAKQMKHQKSAVA